MDGVEVAGGLGALVLVVLLAAVVGPQSESTETPGLSHSNLIHQKLLCVQTDLAYMPPTPHNFQHKV